MNRIEVGSRYGRDRDVHQVSEPEGNHMARTGGHKITIFGFFKFCHFRASQKTVQECEVVMPKTPSKCANYTQTPKLCLFEHDLGGLEIFEK